MIWNAPSAHLTKTHISLSRPTPSPPRISHKAPPPTRRPGHDLPYRREQAPPDTTYPFVRSSLHPSIHSARQCHAEPVMYQDQDWE
ncbi:hypothetical protein P153DRAFT_362155 [Dothidotthia symphoricarpi CBS 119687]|uniref:Uncharacterized protein n=1 Tax=Dothidotthia symphoricarpi CBS 119687 TaxID=1392245 RepID=A0A6A6AS55_9PLEO|nr:uncharacterized protein P153DRAFT_362155 [Dothidotthia symphoricarpi CBS 119687]KAF2134386.1 hypothetical protein P153DRAFT_362155 [Dothidotthia symphoricarpi CBS 119687]